MKLSLRKVRLDCGGYAPEFNHRYFGIGQSLYYYQDAVNNDTDGDDCFLRASNREDAKNKIRAKYKNTQVSFFN